MNNTQPRGKLDEACRTFNIEYQTAAQAARVSRAFESCRRLQDLTWQHHQEAAGRPDAEELLAAAAEHGWTVRELAMWLECYTQQEIGDAVGLDGDTVGLFLQRIRKIDSHQKIGKSAILHDDGFEPARGGRPTVKRHKSAGQVTHYSEHGLPPMLGAATGREHNWYDTAQGDHCYGNETTNRPDRCHG